MRPLETAWPHKIPNIYHFVFGLQPQTKPFHLMHYLCLASCRAVNAPDRIVLHLRNEPWGELWELIRPHIEIETIPDSDLALNLHYNDDYVRSFGYAHISDFIRLRVLFEHGGVYADMDTLFVKPPPTELFDQPCVMGREAIGGPIPQPENSLCNAYIMATPKSSFVRIWMECMPKAFDGSWSNHSTFLPYRLSRHFPDLIRVESESRFFAFDPTRDGIAQLFERDCSVPSDAVSLHLWAHLWWDPERRDFSDFSHVQLTPAYVAHARGTYARLARPFLPGHIAPSTGL